MKHLTFDEVIHYGNGRYAIDWDNGERKYKEPFHGVKVYEHGLIEVCRNGARNPDWRRHVFNNFGLDFRTMPGFGSYSFFDPDTGRKVAKKHMDRTVFLYDRVWGRVYAGNGWGSSFTFLSEHAHRDKFDAATEKVLNFLKSCKSVNDALKKYPDVALYLPQDIKGTVDRVVERAKAGEKEAQVLDVLTEDDRNALTTTGVVGALFVGK